MVLFFSQAPEPANVYSDPAKQEINDLVIVNSLTLELYLQTFFEFPDIFDSLRK